MSGAVADRRWSLTVALVAVLVVLSLIGAVGPSPVGAADEPTTTVAVPDGTSGPADAGIGDLDGGSDTPSPRGEPAPPRSQRVADSAIAVGLLVVLVGGVAIAIRTGRRPDAPVDEAVDEQR